MIHDTASDWLSDSCLWVHHVPDLHWVYSKCHVHCHVHFDAPFVSRLWTIQASHWLLFIIHSSDWLSESFLSICMCNNINLLRPRYQKIFFWASISLLHESWLSSLYLSHLNELDIIERCREAPGAGSIRETSPEKHEKGWKSDFQCKGQLIRLNQEELKYPKTGDNR